MFLSDILKPDDCLEIVQDDMGDCPVCRGSKTVPDESRIWELISNCDINQHWSAMIGVFRGELRAWFCEVAGAQAMLHQDEPDYPDLGFDLVRTTAISEPKHNFNPDNVRSIPWWQLPMSQFKDQVRKHCFDCGVPLRGYGELAQSADGTEQVSQTHADLYKPKKKDRKVQVVTDLLQLDIGKIEKVNHYMQNARI